MSLKSLFGLFGEVFISCVTEYRNASLGNNFALEHKWPDKSFYIAEYKKLSFPSSTSSVNVSKSAGNCRFDINY